MSGNPIQIDKLSKCYRLGQFGAGSLKEEINNWLQRSKGSKGAERNEFWALRDVSFNVAPGEVLGIIGKNGAGKSTLLKILSRITEPTSGSAIIRGKVASLLEVGTGFHPDLSGRENIFLNGTILGMTRKEIALKFDEIVAFAEIDKFIDTPVKRYSSGMYVRLAFSVAAHLDANILLVDEVLSIGDYAFQRKSLQKMTELIRNEGKTIIFVSHVLGSVARLCTRAVMLEKGRMVFEGKTNEVIDRYLMDRAEGNVTAQTCYSGNHIQLSEIVLTRSNDIASEQVMMGEDIVIGFNIEAQEAIRFDSISIEIHNSSDDSMTHISSEDIGLPLATLPAGEKKALSIRLKDVLFSPGPYRISFWFSGNGGMAEDLFPSILQFQMIKGPCVGRPGEYPLHVKTYVKSEWQWL